MNQNKNDQEKIWKQEADQLKKDLDSRSKVIKKREVTIKVNKKNVLTKSFPKSKNIVISKESDSFLRQQLGL